MFEISPKNLRESNNVQCWRGLTLCKHLVRGRLLYLFYWFSICEALHIYSSLGRHMAKLMRGIRMPITSFVITSYALLQGTVSVPQHGQGTSKKSRPSPRCAPSEAEIRPTISFDFPAVRLTGVPARFTTVPVDQYSWAPPAITRHVQILSTILKHEMLFQSYGLVETARGVLSIIVKSCIRGTLSCLCIIYEEALRLGAQRMKNDAFRHF